jgi:hypothetical protein
MSSGWWALAFGLAVCLSGCAPEVGSARWCELMRDKPRGDWTANEAIEYTRSCLLGGE